MSQTTDNALVSEHQVASVEDAPKPEQVKMIEPTVNKTELVQPQFQVTTNLENNSIINQKENQIPSLKDQSISHKQNQPVNNIPTQKTSIQTKPQSITSNQANESPVETQIIEKQPSKTQISSQKMDLNQVNSTNQVNTTQAQNKGLSQTNIKANLVQESPLKLPPNSQIPELKPQNSLSQTKTINQPLITENQTQKSAKNYANSQQIQNKQVQTKVIDSIQSAKTEFADIKKKNQVEKVKDSEKQVITRPQQASSQKLGEKPQLPQSDQGTSFKQLLELLVFKCKQNKQKQKGKQSKKNVITSDVQTDLNLTLASLNPLIQRPQNKIRLQFKIIKPNKIKQQNQTKIKENLQAQQNQSEPTQPALQQNPPLVKNDEKPSGFNIAFCMYNLKEPNKQQIHQSKLQKTQDMVNLQKRLYDVTSAFDSNLFSFKIISKADSEQQNNQLPLRTVNFNFSSTFASTSLGIEPQILEELKSILQNLEEKPEESQVSNDKCLQVPKEQGESLDGKERGQKVLSEGNEVKQKSNFQFSTSIQLSLFEEFKNIENEKLLAFISNGFQLRLKSNWGKQLTTPPHFFEKTLREAMFSLTPSLLTDYLTSISSGTAHIKFRSIKDLRKLLGRLGINQIFDETPTTKEVLKDLVLIQLKSLFKLNAKAQSMDKLSQAQDKVKDKIGKLKVSEIWRVFEALFSEANCKGLCIQITMYQTFVINLTVECCSKNISQLWNEAFK